MFLWSGNVSFERGVGTMSEPTEAQRKFFTDNNLILPPTRDAARSLQDFVERGNTHKNIEQTFDERIMFLRAMQGVWIGQRVVHQMRQDGKKELVHYLSARTPFQMRQAIPQVGILTQKGMRQLHASPLRAMINRAGQMVSIGLERLCLAREAEEVERAASL